MKRLLFSYTYTNFDVLKLFNPQNALDMPCIILAPKKKGAMPMLNSKGQTVFEAYQSQQLWLGEGGEK